MQLKYFLSPLLDSQWESPNHQKSSHNQCTVSCAVVCSSCSLLMPLSGVCAGVLQTPQVEHSPLSSSPAPPGHRRAGCQRVETSGVFSFVLWLCHESSKAQTLRFAITSSLLLASAGMALRFQGWGSSLEPLCR